MRYSFRSCCVVILCTNFRVMGFHLRLAALSASGRRYAPASAAHLIYVNTLMGTDNYSATSKIGTLAVTFGTAARRGLGGAPTSPGPPYCTKCCRVFQYFVCRDFASGFNGC